MPPFLWQTLGARSAEASCKLGCANSVNGRETATGGPQSLWIHVLLLRGRHSFTIGLPGGGSSGFQPCRAATIPPVCGQSASEQAETEPD